MSAEWVAGMSSCSPASVLGWEPVVTLYAFAATAIVGGVMAVLDDLEKRKLDQALRSSASNS